MIVEQRTYTIRPGGVPAYLDVYMWIAMEVRKKHLPHMVGYFSTDIGPLNQIAHMWGYTDLNERARHQAYLGVLHRWHLVVKWN